MVRLRSSSLGNNILDTVTRLRYSGLAMKHPKTLQQAIIFYADPDNCLNHLVSQRWPDGVTCPTCGSKDVRFISTRRIWECKSKHAKKQFSVKVGTIFEDSPIGLDKWLTAAWMVANCKNGVSSYEIHRALRVTQKTAWFMLHRIRLAMQDDDAGKLGGHVEVDETFIGGKARFMHKSKRAKVIKRGPSGKAIVVGVLERGGKVRTQMVENRERQAVQAIVREHVHPGSELSTDEWSAYFGLFPSTFTRSSTTPMHTWTGKSTLTDWKTSGVC